MWSNRGSQRRAACARFCPSWLARGVLIVMLAWPLGVMAGSDGSAQPDVERGADGEVVCAASMTNLWDGFVCLSSAVLWSDAVMWSDTAVSSDEGSSDDSTPIGR